MDKLVSSYLVRVSKRRCHLRIYLLNLKTHEQLELGSFKELSELMERSSLSPPDRKRTLEP